MNITYKPNSRSKNIRIKIVSQDHVEVAYPKLYPLLLVKAYIATKQDWITKQCARFTTQHVCPKGHIHFCGECIPYAIEVKNQKQTSYTWEKEKLTFHIPVLKQKDNKVLADITESFYKQEAQKYIPSVVEIMSSELKVEYKGISFKKQKTRWGSCSSKKNLNFNYLIMREKEEIIKYLVAHEVSHLQEMNHSKKFWSLVETLDKDYKTHAKYLKSVQAH